MSKTKRGKRLARHPGVTSLGDGRYRIRAKVTDPKTGASREIERVVEARDEIDASAQRAALRSEWLTTRTPHLPASRLRLADAAPRWVSDVRPRLRESSLLTYATECDRWCDVLGDHYLDAIEPRDVVAAMTAWRADGTAVSTINRRLRVLRTMARELRVPGMVAGVRILARDLREDEEAEDEGRGLDLAELRRYLDHAPEVVPQWWPLLATLAWTGLRFSEASALEWGDLDLETGIVRVRRAQVRGRVERPKSRAGRRDVVMPDDLVAVLRAHAARSYAARPPGEALVFPAMRERRAGSGSVYVSSSAVGRASVLVCARAGIDLDGRPRLHMLRHSYNNALRQVASELVRQSIVGHADEATGRIYSAVTMDEKRAALAAVVKMWKEG